MGVVAKVKDICGYKNEFVYPQIFDALLWKEKKVKSFKTDHGFI